MRILDYRGRVETAARNPLASPQRPRDFVAQAFPVDRRNTRFVSLARVSDTRQGWKTVTVTKIPGERARRYEQRFHPPAGYAGSFRACRGLRTDCTCGRFTFVWNHALDQHDLAIVDRTNGEPSDVTNPENQLGMCKHGIVALQFLIRENPRFPHATGTNASRGDRVNLRTLGQERNRSRR